MTDVGAGFGGRLEPGRRPALLVVDLIRAYFTPETDLYLGDDRCLLSAARVLDAARSAGVPVLHSRVRYAPGGADGGVFFRKVGALRHLVGDSPEGRFMPQVEPRPDETVIVKQYASSFFGTPLASTLTAMGIDTTMIVGVSTSGCVRATAVDACQHGYVPIVVRDAVGDRSPEPHEANLFDLQAKYAEVVREEDAVRYLSGTRQ